MGYIPLYFLFCCIFIKYSLSIPDHLTEEIKLRIYHHTVPGDQHASKPVIQMGDFGIDQVFGDKIEERRLKRKVKTVDSNNFSKLWPSATLHYHFSDEGYTAFSTTHKAVYAQAVQQWSDSTCLNFVESNDTAQFKLVVSTWNQGHSHASLGYNGAYLGLNACGGICTIADLPEYMELAANTSKISPGLVAHELGHALSLVHEQSRLDRDIYLTVESGNIKSGFESEFVIGNPAYQTDSVPIDYGSIMMYFANIFSNDPSLVTLYSNDPNYISTMGSSSAVTFLDALEVNNAYNCHCASSPVTCSRGGYPNVNSCNECQCPSGFSGTTCNEVEPTPDGGYLLAEEIWTQLRVVTKGQGIIPYRAVYQIRAPPCKKIEILVVYIDRGISTNGIIICKTDYVEFKLGTGEEWRPTGYRFCDLAHSQYLHSEGRDAIVMLNVEQSYTNMILHYRAVDPTETLPSYTIPDVLPKATVTYDASLEAVKSQLAAFEKSLTDTCCGYEAKVNIVDNGGGSVSASTSSCDSNQCEASTEPYIDLPEWPVLSSLPEELTCPTLCGPAANPSITFEPEVLSAMETNPNLPPMLMLLEKNWRHKLGCCMTSDGVWSKDTATGAVSFMC